MVPFFSLSYSIRSSLGIGMRISNGVTLVSTGPLLFTHQTPNTRSREPQKTNERIMKIVKISETEMREAFE